MTLLLMSFYRQKLYREYSQQFVTLFLEWDISVQKTKEEEEKLAVGIRLSFITNRS